MVPVDHGLTMCGHPSTLSTDAASGGGRGVDHFGRTMTSIAAASTLIDRLTEIVGAQHVLSGDAIGADYTHDEALTVPPGEPMAVARPADTAQVAAVLGVADELDVPVTARGAGTGLSGACRPRDRWPGRLVRAHGRHPRDRHRQPPGRGSARGTPRPTRRGPGRPRPRLPGVPRRVLGRRSAATSTPTPGACGP